MSENKIESYENAREALFSLTDFLLTNGVDSPQRCSSMILERCLNMKIGELITQDIHILSKNANEINECALRVAKGEPIQYVLGVTPFRNLELFVKSGVLIPRPETEMIIDIAGYYFKKFDIKDPLIADIGTGSGCLAIACATEFENSHIYATDVSEVAIEVAKKNAKTYNVENRITFETCSCLDNFDYYQHSRNHFNCIMSNPPYVPRSAFAHIDENVLKYEPIVALDGGEDGLCVYREILKKTRGLLEVGGIYIFELFEYCLDDAFDIAFDFGLKNPQIFKDLTGADRFLVAFA